eukprot:Gregarina_sp_Poly_1__11097@NODE_896_length_5808_cov_26_738025_g640_i0_p1_GENE_NODE_896_length_5808_cov_26_738025_g640_i0NODE_896_length_5808_cov_26_738025_g640_i0_p1_ORF_typecomplete_len167_score27_84_NODE_896_length_5808_cov_26_738025_g640_i024252925
MMGDRPTDCLQKSPSQESSDQVGNCESVQSNPLSFTNPFGAIRNKFNQFISDLKVLPENLKQAENSWLRAIRLGGRQDTGAELPKCKIVDTPPPRPVAGPTECATAEIIHNEAPGERIPATQFWRTELKPDTTEIHRVVPNLNAGTCGGADLRSDYWPLPPPGGGY